MAELQRLAISPSQFHNRQFSLTAEQLHYLCRVLRLREGDRFIAVDSQQGLWWLAQLVSGAVAQILEPVPVQTELSPRVTLLVALPKGNGFEDVVRCCTELGVCSLVPVLSERTLLKPSPQKLERWRRIAQEAAEQSERQIIPEILEPVDYITSLDFVKRQSAFICVTRRESSPLLNCLLQLQSEAENIASHIVMMTGPEGGWTEAEVEAAIDAGVVPVSLGRRILRAVTAPVVALSLVSAVFDR